MEMKFLTLLENHNDWLDWVMGRYTDEEGVNEPDKFPCYVCDECVNYNEEGDALFWPHFLYFEEVKEMFEALES